MHNSTCGPAVKPDTRRSTLKNSRHVPLCLLVLSMAMLLPAGMVDIETYAGSTTGSDSEMYGMATVAWHDASGNVVFTQEIHNRLVDSGETFLLEGAFFDGTSDPSDATQIGAICVTDADTVAVAEGETASDFDGDNSLTSNNCQQDTDGASFAGGVATITATFQAGSSLHVPASTEITGIGICQAASSGTSFGDCATNGILFAVVDTSQVTLEDGETVQITYSFDLSSSGT